MSNISNINRVLRIYRDLHVLVFSSGCPSDIKRRLNVALGIVRELLLSLLSQSGSSIRCDK